MALNLREQATWVSRVAPVVAPVVVAAAGVAAAVRFSAGVVQ